MEDCLKRSFESGLRWCGINEEVSNINYSEEAKYMAEYYGLAYTESFNDLNIKNNPVIVIYKDNKTYTDSIYYSVFASDLAPFGGKEIFAIIYGFDSLRKKVLDENN